MVVFVVDVDVVGTGRPEGGGGGWACRLDNGTKIQQQQPRILSKSSVNGSRCAAKCDQTRRFEIIVYAVCPFVEVVDCRRVRVWVVAGCVMEASD